MEYLYLVLGMMVGAGAGLFAFALCCAAKDHNDPHQ